MTKKSLKRLKQFSGSQNMERTSVAEFLAGFQQKKDECAFVGRRNYRATRATYGQIADLSYKLARELEARNIGKGDRIILWGENCAEWAAAFFGCVVRATVVVPLDDIASQEFVLRVVEQVSPKLLLLSRKHLSAGIPVPSLALEDVAKVVAHYPSTPVQPSPSAASDPLEIVFTSGTTAEPKGVVITHGNVMTNVVPLEKEIRKYLKYERLVHPVRFLNLLPLSHVFGQFLGIFLPQLLAATVLFQNALSPAEVLRTIKQERVSVLVAVPRVLQSLKNKLERDLDKTGTLSRFRRRFRNSESKHFLYRWWIFRKIHRQFGWKFWAFICGGATLDQGTEEFWGRLGYAVIQGYGLTETTSLISVNHPFKLGKGSVGKVLAGREVKLGEAGEILVRGGGVASAYWSGKDLKPVANEDGWYRTGDIGELDDEGNLYFKGRKKDVIVTPAGMNIYPEDLEAALRRQPQIHDCVVVGLEREGNAEPVALLILSSKNADVKGAIQRANQSLAEFQRINTWLVWPEEDFPRTSTHKPRKNELAIWVQQKSGQIKNQAISKTPLAEIIARVTGRPPSTLEAGANLEADLNLSSLDRVELMSALEDRYQVDLSETSFSAANTVADLENLLRGGTPQRVIYHYPRWALRWPVLWVRVIVHYLLLRPAVLLLGWPRITGRENLVGVQGPVLVVCNHIDDVDVGYVLTALPARFRHRLAAAAGGEAMELLRTPTPARGLWRRVFDRVAWYMGAALLNIFPLPRQAGFRQSFAYAGDCIDHRYNVLIFPEGQHTRDGKLLPFQYGIGILSNSLQVPIVPMKLMGLFEVKASGRKFARPGQISVHIGKPITFPAETNPITIANQLHNTVDQL